MGNDARSAPPGEDEGRGGADAPPRRTPTADEIEVPDSWQVQVDDDEGKTGSDDEEAPLRRRRPAASGRLARRAGGMLFFLDRLLLAIAVLGPLLILGYQSFEWLRTSEWSPISVEGTLVFLQIGTGAGGALEWEGANQALDWVLASPLSLFLFVAGLLLHVLTGLLFPRTPGD